MIHLRMIGNTSDRALAVPMLFPQACIVHYVWQAAPLQGRGEHSPARILKMYWIMILRETLLCRKLILNRGLFARLLLLAILAMYSMYLFVLVQWPPF